MPKAHIPLRRKASDARASSSEGQEKPEIEISQLKNQLARSLADYDNFRKRTEAREMDLKFVVTARVVLRFLPILDMLYEAQKHLNDSGIALTIKEFEEVFKSEGLERITIKNGESIFDESLHEAIEVVADSNKDNIICEEVVSGWKFVEGQVIRPAKVKVYQKIS